MSRRSPPSPLALVSGWSALERIEHPLAWLDEQGRVLGDNAAFRRRRGEHEDLGWILGSESRRAVADALGLVASAVEARRTVEMASPGDRWEALTLHAIRDRPGTVLLEIQDVTRRRLEERRLAAQSIPVQALLGEAPSPGAAGVGGADGAPRARTLAAIERLHVTNVLAASGHCVSRAASDLGISRSTLYAVMRRHGITIPPAGARRRRGG